MLRYVVPPTKDDNACSKIQAITNLSSNDSLFPFVLVCRISRIFLAMKFSVMDVLDDFIFFYFFLFPLIPMLIFLMIMVSV